MPAPRPVTVERATGAPATFGGERILGFYIMGWFCVMCVRNLTEEYDGDQSPTERSVGELPDSVLYARVPSIRHTELGRRRCRLCVHFSILAVQYPGLVSRFPIFHI